MQLPGSAAELEQRIRQQKAEQEAERLLEELKKEVQVQIAEIGTLRKELRITIPARIIAEHLDYNYSELMHDVVVPGFRKGRAPRKLVEKRFGSEVRESLTTSLVGQSFFAATENHNLEVLGDPLFRIETEQGAKLVEFDEALQHLKLPASGDFSYVCEVEVKPTFELPELKGIPVRTPQITITDQMIDEELLRQRKLRGRFEPFSEGGAQRDDLLVADVTLYVDDQPVKSEENVQIGVRPSAIDGIRLPQLADALSDVGTGQTRSVTCTIPDDYERADLRGKPARLEFRVHEIKRLIPLSTEEFLKRGGFASEAEARDFYRAAMESERDELIERARKEQICDYLLSNTRLELPEKLSTRQIERAALRRMLDLRLRGVPDSDILAQADALRASAKEDVTRSLKLSFILAKVAEKLEVDVTDEEVNTEIARIARRYNRRFDRVRDELQRDGLLDQLAEQIRHDKCVERLLADAEPITTDAEPQKAARRGRSKA